MVLKQYLTPVIFMDPFQDSIQASQEAFSALENFPPESTNLAPTGFCKSPPSAVLSMIKIKWYHNLILNYYYLIVCMIYSPSASMSDFEFACGATNQSPKPIVAARFVLPCFLYVCRASRASQLLQSDAKSDLALETGGHRWGPFRWRFRHFHCAAWWNNNWATQPATHLRNPDNTYLTWTRLYWTGWEMLRKCWEYQGLDSFCQKSSGGWRGIARHFGQDLAPEIRFWEARGAKTPRSKIEERHQCFR